MKTDQAERIGVRDAREAFPTLVDAAHEGARFVVTLYGKDRCAIVSMEDLQALEVLQATGKRSGRRTS